MNIYQRIEELAFFKRIFASGLTLLLVGGLASLFFSTLSDSFDFWLYFIAIVYFKIPAIIVGFVFSYVIDRWVIKKVEKEAYPLQLLLYSAMGIVISIPYSIILADGRREPQYVMWGFLGF